MILAGLLKSLLIRLNAIPDGEFEVDRERAESELKEDQAERQSTREEHEETVEQARKVIEQTDPTSLSLDDLMSMVSREETGDQGDE